MKFTRLNALALAASLAAIPALAADTIKIAYLEPLSGGMANVGEEGAHNFQFVIDQINAAGGALGRKFELVPLDNKLSPQETLIQLKTVTDQKIQYVVQGQGSSVAGAIVDALNKHNERNPDSRVLFLNYAAVDPDLTNSKCSFWHFRWDANTDMKMAGLTDQIKKESAVKKIFLINQDYAHGQQVARAAKEMLKQKRPDIQIVGDDLHPLAKVKDFSPYVAKIRSSGADSVITGNWGNDLSLLIKAAKDAGLSVTWYTYYAGGPGVMAAVGEAGIGKVKQIYDWNNNVANPAMEKFYVDFKKAYPEPKDEFIFYRIKPGLEMLAKAMEQVKSTDPTKVAYALEGMTHTAALGAVTMRKDDHQLLQNMYMFTMDKVGTPGVKLPFEGSPYGLRTDAMIPAKDITLPTTCKMQRPK